MSPRTDVLVTPAELAAALASPTPPVVLDVRWHLGEERGAGRQRYAAAHLPSAAFLDLEKVLTRHTGNPRDGRHPLPRVADVRAGLAAVGVRADRETVVYDEAGSFAAARAWWVLRWVGLPVRVLDGGVDAWVAAGHSLQAGDPFDPGETFDAGGAFDEDEALGPNEAFGEVAAAPAPAVPAAAIPERAAHSAPSAGGHSDAAAPTPTGGPVRVPGRPQSAELIGGHMPTLTADEAAAVPGHGVLIDVRAPERFRGEVEPIDPVAGHIPGAVNIPVAGLFAPDGLLPDEATLRERLAPALAAAEAGRAVAEYCGSGVSAAQAVLALATLGVEAALYPGSWSAWCHDPTRPVATGE